jgi:hypothetical protein
MKQLVPAALLTTRKSFFGSTSLGDVPNDDGKQLLPA